jgi:hypothetical protein
MQTTVQAPELLSAPQVCVRLNRSYATLQAMIRAGRFPKPLPQTAGQGRTRYWLAEDVERALEKM